MFNSGQAQGKTSGFLRLEKAGPSCFNKLAGVLEGNMGICCILIRVERSQRPNADIMPCARCLRRVGKLTGFACRTWRLKRSSVLSSFRGIAIMFLGVHPPQSAWNHLEGMDSMQGPIGGANLILPNAWEPRQQGAGIQLSKRCTTNARKREQQVS